MRDAERLGQVLIVLGFLIGTVVGFFQQSLYVAVIGWIAGAALTVVACVPPWPVFCRHPIKWRPAKYVKKK